MQQEVNDYLKQRLTVINPYELSSDEEKKVARDKAGFVMDKLMRKQFRRRIAVDVREATAKKITHCIKNEPINLVIPFGGYKHFWNPSHPEPDWAEVFHLRWMTDYVLPILAVHEPGDTILEYVSEDLILPRMNNYPDDALESYTKTFQELLKWYGQYTPKNLQLQYWRVGDKHDKQAIIDKVEALLPERKAAFNKLDKEAQEREIHRSQRSVFWKGKENLSDLSEQQKHERIIESRIIELAFYDTESSPEFVGEYYWQDNRICVCFSFGLSHDNDEFGDLTIKSAPGSNVDHWIGLGILKRSGAKLFDTIVSQKQYKELQSQLTLVKVEPRLVPLKNYTTIEITS